MIRRALSFFVASALALPSAALARSHAHPHSRPHASGKGARKGKGKGSGKAHASLAHHATRHGEREAAVPTYTRGGMPNIQAHAAVVLDLGKGDVLYQKNADEVRSIASISKLMAMMVVLEHQPDLDARTTITDDDRRFALRGARSRLPVGMAFTNRDLLHAALMASDNRAVLALGRAVGLDRERFTRAMNDKARALGLAHTGFGDPTGLDDRNHSTPREVAKMLTAALSVPLISEVTRKGAYVAHGSSPRHGCTVEYANTDVLARGRRYSVLGGKTGYTDVAGYCLAVAARLDGHGDVAMVFLGESGKMTRFADFSRAATWLAEKRPVVASATGPSAATASSPALPSGPAAPAASALPALPPPVAAGPSSATPPALGAALPTAAAPSSATPRR